MYILHVRKKLYPTSHLLSGLRLFIQLVKNGWKSVEHLISHNWQMMDICQVASMNKSNKTSNQPMDYNKTTERGRNTRPTSIMIFHLLFLSVWSCNHKCCHYNLHDFLTRITEQVIYHQHLLVKRRQNARLWRSAWNSNAWTENGQYWASSELLLHFLELVMSRVISALLFYKSCDFISPLSTL